MRVLDGTGDTVVAWEVDDEESVAVATEVFLAEMAERKMPFARAVGAPASESYRVSAFDPSVAEIIWVRPIAGG